MSENTGHTHYQPQHHRLITLPLIHAEDRYNTLRTMLLELHSAYKSPGHFAEKEIRI